MSKNKCGYRLDGVPCDELFLLGMANDIVWNDAEEFDGIEPKEVVDLAEAIRVIRDAGNSVAVITGEKKCVLITWNRRFSSYKKS